MYEQNLYKLLREKPRYLSLGVKCQNVSMPKLIHAEHNHFIILCRCLYYLVALEFAISVVLTSKESWAVKITPDLSLLGKSRTLNSQIRTVLTAM